MPIYKKRHKKIETIIISNFLFLLLFILSIYNADNKANASNMTPSGLKITATVREVTINVSPLDNKCQVVFM